MVAPIWSAEPWYIGLVICLFLLGAASTKDFADIEGDRAGGCRTLPIVYGVKKAAWMISPVLRAALDAAAARRLLRDPRDPSHAILTGNPWLLSALGVLLMVWGAYTVYLLVRDPPR